MPKFAVHVHGTGCWLAFEEQRGGEWTQIAPSPHGFYTVRYVETPSAEEAVAKVFESIHAEVQSLYRDGYPRCIELDEVLEDPKGFAKYGPGAGFTWYPEEAEQTDDH